jgi:hypothetical protein
VCVCASARTKGAVVGVARLAAAALKVRHGALHPLVRVRALLVKGGLHLRRARGPLLYCCSLSAPLPTRVPFKFLRAVRRLPPRQCRAWRRLSPRDSPALPRSRGPIWRSAQSTTALPSSCGATSPHVESLLSENTTGTVTTSSHGESATNTSLSGESYMSVCCGLYHLTSLKIEMGSAK